MQQAGELHIVEFIATVEANRGERKVFEALQKAFKGEEGLCILRYPVFSEAHSWRYEPDILVLHRELGVIVIEVKGCHAQNVEALEGHSWRMVDWTSPVESPQEQAEKQMWALKDHFDRVASLRSAVRFRALVALPEVLRSEWVAKGFEWLPCNPPILHKDHLTPAAMRARLTELLGPQRQALSESQWRAVLSVVGFGHSLPKSNWTEYLSVSARETVAQGLDAEQLRIGLEIPPGPQRLRGIAGSGKTLLLALKAARMHYSHPDWDIAFSFNSKSLYQVIRGHIERFYRHIAGKEPDWSKLRVLHAWGSQRQPGFYRTVATASGVAPRGAGWAQRLAASPAEQLALVCQEVLDRGSVPEQFDAVLVDEGQDLAPAFYRLAYAALREPRRLVWAYDEAQSLDTLALPTAELLFGRTPEGDLKVDLTGSYPGGIQKSRIMRRCYRTPRALLMAAHALGMGLCRPGGAVQGFTTRQQWQDIGNDVVEGAFDSPGTRVVITRPPQHCGHPLDTSPEPTLDLHRHPDRRSELEWCALEVSGAIWSGVAADDILIVMLGDGPSDVAREELFRSLAWLLESKGVAVHLADEKENTASFRMAGAVTLSGVRRAKGNEAPVVFVLGLDRIGMAEGDVGARNQLFVALSRARARCYLSGQGHQADPLLAEARGVLGKGSVLEFMAPDARRLKRKLDEVAPATGRPIEPVPFITHLPFYDVGVAAGPWENGRVFEEQPSDWVYVPFGGDLSPEMCRADTRRLNGADDP